MAEYIERGALLKALNEAKIPYNADVNYFITNAPAADVQEVTRCRECAYFDQDAPTDVFGHCFTNHRMTKDDNFCSWAKRKDDTNAID